MPVAGHQGGAIGDNSSPTGPAPSVNASPPGTFVSPPVDTNNMVDGDGNDMVDGDGNNMVFE